ncbi:MAG: hypothetical protein LBD06_01450 [Candidatus Accumulibacter sp.]|nr:hypothetical protein [Accumulibacter sp.]
MNPIRRCSVGGERSRRRGIGSFGLGLPARPKRAGRDFRRQGLEKTENGQTGCRVFRPLSSELELSATRG